MGIMLLHIIIEITIISIMKPENMALHVLTGPP